MVSIYRQAGNELYKLILNGLAADNGLPEANLKQRDFRAGDARHSLDDSSKVRDLLGYQPSYRVHKGLEEAMESYVKHQ